MKSIKILIILLAGFQSNLLISSSSLNEDLVIENLYFQMCRDPALYKNLNEQSKKKFITIAKKQNWANTGSYLIDVLNSSLEVSPTLCEDRIEFLVDTGAKIHTSDLILHTAARFPRKKIIKKLLDAGANARTLDNEGCTVLHHIKGANTGTQCTQRDLDYNDALEAIEMLIAAGADPNYPNNQGISAKIMFKQLAHYDNNGSKLLKYLEKNNNFNQCSELAQIKINFHKMLDDINFYNNLNDNEKQNIINTVKKENWTQHLNTIVPKMSGDINSLDKYIHKIKLLLAVGADINTLSLQNSTALHNLACIFIYGSSKATEKNHSDFLNAVQILIDSRANLDISDRYNKTPRNLLKQCKNNATPELLNYLNSLGI